MGAAVMSTLRKRLESVEERIALQQHRELQRQLKGRSKDEQEFFCIHGYWPENASELPRRIEFTARGIKTVVTTQWEGEAQKSED
jgi:ribonuclease I